MSVSSFWEFLSPPLFQLLFIFVEKSINYIPFKDFQYWWLLNIHFCPHLSFKTCISTCLGSHTSDVQTWALGFPPQICSFCSPPVLRRESAWHILSISICSTKNKKSSCFYAWSQELTHSQLCSLWDVCRQMSCLPPYLSFYLTKMW